MINELQLRVILGLFLPLIAIIHAIWKNHPAIFLGAILVGLVWVTYRELFSARTCVDAALLYPAEMGLAIFISYSLAILVVS